MGTRTKVDGPDDCPHPLHSLQVTMSAPSYNPGPDNRLRCTKCQVTLAPTDRDALAVILGRVQDLVPAPVPSCDACGTPLVGDGVHCCAGRGGSSS